MQTDLRFFRIFPVALLFLALLLAQDGSGTEERIPSGDEIIARMLKVDRERTEQLREYTSVRHYRLVNERLKKMAEMTVQMTYRHPGTKNFTIIAESGSAIIREKVLRRMLEAELEASKEALRLRTQITPENYNFRFLGATVEAGRRAYLFDLSPRARNKFMIRGRVWLDAQDLAITRIEGSPAKAPSLFVHRTNFVHQYQKVGPFWLAASNVSRSESLVFGHTLVEIKYVDYQIHSADSDPRCR